MLSRLFLFFLLTTALYSCRKEDDAYDPAYLNLQVYHHYHLKGIVIDTLTGIPVANARVCQFQPYYADDKYTLGRTTAVGWYSGDYTWGGDVRYTHALPDSADIYIYAYTNNQCGKVKVKFGQLIENGLHVMTPLYVKPVGYLKTHIKDTSGIGAPLIYCKGNYNIIEPISIQVPEYFFTSTHPAGHIYDTTFVCKVYPNSNATLTFSYGTTSLAPSTVFVPSGDTSFVNIFY
ncbi:MAG: hypothetical protein JWP12_928 [Bacteroidetes bacterium]|nr:hypothetical protein [Bacteroidota bacterium]